MTNSVATQGGTKMNNHYVNTAPAAPAKSFVGPTETIDYIAMRQRNLQIEERENPKKAQLKRDMERQERNEMLQLQFNSWLKPEERRITLDTVDEILSCVKGTIELIGRKYSTHFLLPIMLYADKFVKRSGLIEQDHVLNLLLISTVVTVKFWVDTGVDIDVTAYVSGIPKKTISLMERNFLSIIDYALYLTPQEIEKYYPLAVN
eukprot:TRINITY_DN2560_c0_g1_i1.p1 TRINITY_DN2560_c0_g1~~TRINITY_DN2560_c0_g1_i1.p1  ORF type:complete len:205 (-),score=54.81 TRINITY_DN2560_c0_g1_i1:595-1209(-)